MSDLADRSDLQTFDVSRRIRLAAMSIAASAGRVGADVRAPDRPIDVHHHFFPPIAKKLYGPFPPLQEYTSAVSLEAMNRAGVELACLSLPTQLPDETGSAQATSFARTVNDFAMQMEAEHPDRFRLFGFLPLPHIDASLHEIEYLFGTLKVSGICVLSNYGTDWIGEARFTPVLEELNNRHAVVYVHPTDAPCCMDLLPNTIPQTVEWNTSTSRAIWSVINDGTDRPPVTVPGDSVATRYPKIRWIWSHAGGSLLGLVGRFLGRGGTRNVRLADLATAPAGSKLHHLRRFYYDTAISANPIQMQALKSLVGIEQIVFGSDFPFLRLQDTIESLAGCGFSNTELAAVNRDNVMGLL